MGWVGTVTPDLSGQINGGSAKHLPDFEGQGLGGCESVWVAEAEASCNHDLCLEFTVAALCLLDELSEVAPSSAG
jgi:hypothetical protein